MDSTASMQEHAKVPRVAVRLDELHGSLENLDNKMQILFEKLTPVLGPDMAEPKPGDMSTPTPDQSEIANSIENAVRTIHRIIGVVGKSIERIEL